MRAFALNSYAYKYNCRTAESAAYECLIQNTISTNDISWKIGGEREKVEHSDMFNF